MTFEAPRELLDPSTRDRTLQEIRELGVDRVRALVYWKDVAPPRARSGAPTSTRPTRTPTRPARGRAWTGCSTRAQARGITVQLTLTGPVPRWATKGKRDNLTCPSTTEFQAFVTAVGRRYGAEVDVGRSGTSPTTRSSCSRSS